MECIHCREAIKTGASVCVHCRKQQSRWYSRATELAAVAGAISLAIAAGAFLVDRTPKYWRSYLGDELKLVDLYADSNGRVTATLGNAGPDDLHVGQLEIFVPERQGWKRVPVSKDLDVTIGPAQIVSVSFDSDKDFGSRTTVIFGGRGPNQTFDAKASIGFLRLAECFLVTFEEMVPDAFDEALAEDDSSVAGITHEATITYYSASRAIWRKASVRTKSSVWKSTKSFCGNVVPDEAIPE